MEFTSIYYVNIKGSSVYYGGKRLNHSQLVELCVFIYDDLKLFHSLFPGNYSLRPALFWQDFTYKGLVNIISRLILDSALITGSRSVFPSARRSVFVHHAKYPSFLNEIKKNFVSVEFRVLYFFDKFFDIKNPAGYLYGSRYFQSFSDLENYVRGFYPSDKYEIEFISRWHG